jgi:GntR family transcriptional regulator
MFTKPNPHNGVPIYVQIKEQILHAIEKGAISPGGQLPSVRGFAEQLVINPNTVIKIYKELEVEGVVEIRHGMGAFVRKDYAAPAKTAMVRQGSQALQKIVDGLINKGLSPEEIRRMVEAALQKYYP